MSDEAVPNSHGPASVRVPVTTDPNSIPVDQVKPEDSGTLSIEYWDGRPVIVVSGGKYIPAHLPVVDTKSKASNFPGWDSYESHGTYVFASGQRYEGGWSESLTPGP
ncbi:hypothetical protein ACIBSV_29135 [Embleya sp. NPDC050154]|uniref:hypothetical protein n=1 Tax=Embleya sp. NPDC050154 TaxID=3363988 RepID=UPI0037B51AC9